MNVIPCMGVVYIGMTGNTGALISCGLAAAVASIMFDGISCGIVLAVDTLVSQAYARNDIDA